MLGTEYVYQDCFVRWREKGWFSGSEKMGKGEKNDRKKRQTRQRDGKVLIKLVMNSYIFGTDCELKQQGYINVQHTFHT